MSANEGKSLNHFQMSTIKSQLEGQKGSTVKLLLRLLREKNASDAKYTNRLVHVELIFKFGVSDLPNRIYSSISSNLKQDFDLIESSAKVITILCRVTMSNKWAACSPNTYGIELKRSNSSR